MKIAPAQMRMTGNVQENLEKSLKFCDLAEDCDLLFFPEIQLSPFFPQYEKQDAEMYVMEKNGQEIAELAGKAKEHQYYLSPNVYLKLENPMKNSRRRMCHVRGRELFIFYASVFKKVLSRFAGICPGADAFPAVPKVTQEPTSCPQIRLITPAGLMDIVITGVSLCSSFIVIVASSSVRTSRSHWGITANFTMSAPRDCIRQRLFTMMFLSGVAVKSWREATTFTPTRWAAATSVFIVSSPRESSTSTRSMRPLSITARIVFV